MALFGGPPKDLSLFELGAVCCTGAGAHLVLFPDPSPITAQDGPIPCLPSIVVLGAAGEILLCTFSCIFTLKETVLCVGKIRGTR